MCGRAVPFRKASPKFLRLCLEISGVAAKKFKAINRKGTAFPHIGGQSPKNIF
jgi:hypothetical protein